MPIERFATLAEKLEEYSCPEALTGCILWTRARCSSGYGSLHWRGKYYSAHRAAYEVAKGPIPEGMVLDHLCRNPACCNPDHLEVVTNKENVLRGVGPTAENAAKTHCDKGHPLSGENLYFYKGYMRTCLACRRVDALNEAQLERRHKYDRGRYPKERERRIQQAKDYYVRVGKAKRAERKAAEKAARVAQ